MRSTNVLRLKFFFFLICDTLSGLVLLTEILFLPFLSLLHKMSYYLPYFFIKETQSHVFFSFIAQQTVSRASCVSTITTAIMWFLPIAGVKITLFKGSWGGLTFCPLSDLYYLNELMLMWRLFTDTDLMGIPDLSSFSICSGKYGPSISPCPSVPFLPLVLSRILSEHQLGLFYRLPQLLHLSGLWNELQTSFQTIYRTWKVKAEKMIRKHKISDRPLTWRLCRWAPFLLPVKGFYHLYLHLPTRLNEQ